MENILYIDDYINLYNKKSNKLITYKPYKKSIENGLIKDKNKFIKLYNKILSKYSLKKSFFNENICVVINKLYSVDDKNKIIDILDDLNYRKIKLIQENELIKITNNNLNINYNDTYFYITYIDNIGNIKTLLYENDDINKELIVDIIKRLNKKNVVIYGKNAKELENILEKNNINYNIYEELDNLFIKILKKY